MCMDITEALLLLGEGGCTWKQEQAGHRQETYKTYGNSVNIGHQVTLNNYYVYEL